MAKFCRKLKWLGFFSGTLCITVLRWLWCHCSLYVCICYYVSGWHINLLMIIDQYASHSWLVAWFVWFDAVSADSVASNFDAFNWEWWTCQWQCAITAMRWICYIFLYYVDCNVTAVSMCANCFRLTHWPDDDQYASHSWLVAWFDGFGTVSADSAASNFDAFNPEWWTCQWQCAMLWPLSQATTVECWPSCIVCSSTQWYGIRHMENDAESSWG